jgi:hypothetical protein
LLIRRDGDVEMISGCHSGHVEGSSTRPRTASGAQWAVRESSISKRVGEGVGVTEAV